ncbi:uncharacterized protein LOC133825874 [Humulus lupulus]|uniref:uncharacterized protein LOC133825874 n=1 Tax=Humulus lupulus TaxID=3486 RepID=UPI002B414C69|nr:uncharacterized protein LOC133825874 [Humulus lupulus]
MFTKLISKAATANTSQNVITLKLLIDAKKKEVIFAEAGKEFTDFLFSILRVPIGTMIRLFLTNDIGMVGTLGKLYKSLENLSENYMQSNLNKDTLLKPEDSAEDGSMTQEKLYYCSSCSNYGSDIQRANCPNCRREMSRELTYVQSSSSGADQEGGFHYKK